MKVENIVLKNFRNIESCSLEPDSRLNVLVGANGQGKTSILEAIGYLATLRSFRGAKTEEVIRTGQSDAEVACTLAEAAWRTQLKILFQGQPQTKPDMPVRTSKTAFINGKAFHSSTQYLSQRFGSVELGFHAIAFNPSDHELVHGEPAQRRQYLNRVLAAEDVDYLKTLQKFQRLLEQRNALLKSENVRLELLRSFSEPLADYAARVVRSRLDWLQRLCGQLEPAIQRIAPKQGRLKALYASKWVPEIAGLSFYNNELQALHFTGQQELPSLELLKQSFLRKMSALEDVEIRTGSTMIGPHRDDWAFYLDDRSLKGRGSQGEVRSALLALKLSEIGLFRERTGHRPLLLLDDFSSELDRQRRELLLELLQEMDLQVFISTTEEPETQGKVFRISEGKVER